MTRKRRGQRQLSDELQTLARKMVFFDKVPPAEVQRKLNISESSLRRACGGSLIFGNGPEKYFS